MSLLILTGAGLAYGGLAAKSFAMDRHYADIVGRGAEPDPRHRLRCALAGWLALALSFMACICAMGWHIGPVLWCGLLTASAIVLTLGLQYAPRRALQAARLCALGAAAAGTLAMLIR
ncbi:DUF3325 domain-containing protein [Massilia sp. IC2-477]|uniref:DUF3325 domain-containing protein n=1 Tax=unclassified Massilia TaxID=2609279 RepID=UPI001D101EFD|nr:MULTISPECIES: DUF3325 domain-containing protein [unclassified Massilia]MCC2957517.1 DUF3325 domain-containing protein [Massilia sp. IC2-477]MCC2973595.1 DUF3325 domain-containing protein [Massilia sp. IC2-476]